MYLWVARVLVSSIKDAANLRIRLGVLEDTVVFLRGREGGCQVAPNAQSVMLQDPRTAWVINL